MALITCPNCGKRVSDKAEKCIYCGCVLEEDEEISMSARDAFNYACAEYEKAKDLIKELSVWTKTVAKDFSVEEALSHYDLFLQCVLLHTYRNDPAPEGGLTTASLGGGSFRAEWHQLPQRNQCRYDRPRDRTSRYTDAVCAVPGKG